ncbi:MAG: alpha/beta hydrolase [Anaerolineales bacterium]|jgi:carboxylesterase
MRTIMPGGEPFYLPGSRTGCLLAHGFTAAPQEVHELGMFLSNAGYTVLGVRLAGHATRWQDLARTRWQDWLASLQDGYAMLQDRCDRIVLMGSSTGGCLSLLLASSLPTAGVVTMSAPYQLPPIPALRVLYPILGPVSRILPRLKKGPPDWRDPGAAVSRVQYDCYPLRAAREFGLMLDAMRAVLADIRVPALLMHSRQDGFIPYRDMGLLAQALENAAVRTFTVEESNHIISCDISRGQVFDQALNFVRAL